MSAAEESTTSSPIAGRTILALIGVNLLALVVRLVFFSGLQGGDDAIYLSLAHNYAANSAIDPEPSHWAGRILVWLPIAAGLKLGWSAVVALSWFPLLCSLATLNALFWVARARLGENAAILATLLWAIFPLEVIYATTSYCDGPVGGLAFLTCACFIWQYESRRPHLWGFLAGLSLAAAYLCRETVLILVVPLAGIALVRKHFVRAAWTGFLGASVLLVAEVAFWQIETGDPLRRLHSTSESLAGIPLTASGQPGQAPEVAKSTSWWFSGPPGYPPYYHENPLKDAAHSLFINEEYALFMIVGLPLLLWQVVRRDWVAWEYLLIFWVLLALTLFFPFFSLKYTLRRDPRYCSVIVGPMCLCLAHELQRWRVPALRFGLVALLALASLAGLQATQGSRTRSAFRELHDFRRLHAGTRLWTSPLAAVTLAYYSSYDGDEDVGLTFFESNRTSHRTEE